MGDATPRLDRQRCKSCWHACGFSFQVSNALWERVAGPFQGHVLCLACFDERAFELGIDYSADIQLLFFAGDQCAFVFKPISADEVESIEATTEYRRLIA